MLLEPHAAKSPDRFDAFIAVALRCLSLIAVLGFVAAIATRPSTVVDEDIWWHIRSGEWIAQHGAVPWHDPFAQTQQHSWIAYTWLFDLISWKTHQLWGLLGILIGTMLLALGSVICLILLLSAYVGVTRAALLSSVSFIAFSPVVTPRPWLFTILGFVLTLYLLTRARDTAKIWWLFPIPILFAIWANLHIQFVNGLALIGFFAAEPVLRRVLTLSDDPGKKLKPAAWWIVLAVSAIGALANPYTWRIYTAALHLASQRVPVQAIQEMHALTFGHVSDWAALALLLAAVWSVGRHGSRIPPAFVLLLIAGSLLGFRAARDVWFLAISAALVLAAGAPRTAVNSGAKDWIHWPVALAGSSVLTLALFLSPGVSNPALESAIARRFPVAAARYVSDHGLQNPLYNSFDWGGYLMWRLPHMPVSIDGRTLAYEDSRLRQSVDTWFGKPGWKQDPQLNDARTILLERDCPLASILRASPEFNCLWEDELASIFVPK